MKLRLTIFAVLTLTSLASAEDRALNEDTVDGLLTASLETKSIDSPVTTSSETQVDVQTQDNENQDQLEEILNQDSARDDNAELDGQSKKSKSKSKGGKHSSQSKYKGGKSKSKSKSYKGGKSKYKSKGYKSGKYKGYKDERRRRSSEGGMSRGELQVGDANNLEDNMRGTGRDLPADIEETDSRETHAPFDYYKYNGYRCRVEVYDGNELRTTLMTDKPSWKEHRGFSYWHSDPKTVDMRGKDISWLRYSNCKKLHLEDDDSGSWVEGDAQNVDLGPHCRRGPTWNWKQYHLKSDLKNDLKSIRMEPC